MEMFKATSRGIESKGEFLPPLSKEDRETIADMFEEYQKQDFVSKEGGVWKFSNPIYER